MMQASQTNIANMSDSEAKIIRETLSRLLASREHSRHELLNKLLAKGLDAATCLIQLDEFTQNNLQSDQRYAESLIRGRCNNGYGELRIRAELREQQIDEELISDCLQRASVDWYRVASKALHKKFGETLADDWQAQQKRKRFLHYRGFSYEQIQELVD